jgi:hypothetical protein
MIGRPMSGKQYIRKLQICNIISLILSYFSILIICISTLPSKGIFGAKAYFLCSLTLSAYSLAIGQESPKQEYKTVKVIMLAPGPMFGFLGFMVFLMQADELLFWYSFIMVLIFGIIEIIRVNKGD